MLKSVNIFYDQILEWVDEFANGLGKTLDDLSAEGYDLTWQDHATVNFVHVKDGTVKRVKAFRMEIATHVSIPFIGNVGDCGVGTIPKD